MDGVGNSGKSWMTDYLDSTGEAFICDATSKADVAYAYGGERFVVFDLSRQQTETINKYEEVSKCFLDIDGCAPYG